MQESQKRSLWSMMETVILVGAASAVFLAIGRRDQVIETNALHIAELRSIVTELVKSQVLSESMNSQHISRMNSLELRINRLEAGG
tara:strand:- start:3006 stop:3263 length:258 start_codon:yes stop_codon:yes gene_type:complete